MGRRRKNNKHLPFRVYLKHGAYYFVDPAGKWHRLGGNLAEVYREYSQWVEAGPVQTMDHAFDRYTLEVIPSKAPRTQRDNMKEIDLLRQAFGAMEPRGFLPRHGYAYYNERAKRSLTRAVKEMALLSHVFTKCVEWGVVDSNPCRQIRKHRPEPRRRYVEDWEYQVVYDAMPAMIQISMDLIHLTSLRPGDVLGLTRKHLKEDGILIVPAKTRRARPDGTMSSGKPLLIEWSDELRSIVDRALKSEPRFRQAIVCKKDGGPYTSDGFNSIWYRHMRKAVNNEDNPLTESFQFRDLRAKSASDDTAAAATARLGHSDPKMTESVYRRKPTRVRPLR